MKNILVKEIDCLKSKIHKNKNVSEYIIYLREDINTVLCYTEFGEINKNARVNEIISNYFFGENNFSAIEINNIIQEIKLEK